MKILVAFAALAALSFAPAHAATIDTTGGWDGTSSISSFGGGSTGVYGNTFVSPGSAINSFSFFIDDGGAAIDVVGQVYAWSGSLLGGNGPQGATGPALFTSAQFTTAGVSGFREISVNTGSTALTAGQNYVVLLAAVTPGSTSSVWGVLSGGSGIAGDGGFNFYNNDYTLGSISTNDWDSFNNFGTLAWRGSFDGAGVVPEPASWALMIIGFGAVGTSMRRRRRSAVVFS